MSNLCVVGALFLNYGLSFSFRNKMMVRSRNIILFSSSSISTEEMTIYDEITKQASMALSQAPEGFVQQMNGFLSDYKESNIASKYTADKYKFNLMTFLKTIQQAYKAPHQFQPYHQALREPFDYYSWGNDFLKPMIIMEQSRMLGKDNAEKMLERLKDGENVVILSNHQTEADPQVISVLLEQNGLAELAEKMIFIAGHKVTNDPVCIPFSMGRNLICIHSKKHIKNPPEDMPKKQAQNLESMQAMGALFSQGGHVFWVAPSGGRDRPDEAGEFVVAPFDLKALDMFKMLGMQSRKPLSFYPMAMYSNKLVPPPKDTSSGLGEARSGKRGPVSIHLLDRMEDLGGLKDKEYTASVQTKVNDAYKALSDWHQSH